MEDENLTQLKTVSIARARGTRKMIFNPDISQRVKELFSSAVKNRMEPEYFI